MHNKLYIMSVMCIGREIQRKINDLLHGCTTLGTDHLTFESEIMLYSSQQENSFSNETQKHVIFDMVHCVKK